MTKLEFMRALEEQLLVLPYQERLDALEYYDEYFDDAGIENEQQVAEQLVSPEVVAAKILGKSTSSQQQQQQQYQTPPSYAYQQPRQHKSNIPLWLILALSPVWIPLAIGVLAVIVGFLITVVALGLSFVIMAVALVLMTVICLIVAVPLLITDPLNGMYVLGCALVSCGVGVMFLPLCGLLLKKCVPACAKGIGKLAQGIGRIFVPREAEREW